MSPRGCGCQTECACALVAGENVTTSGTGQPGDPWVINAAGSTPQETIVNDTPTVNLTNAGTPQNPVITADVILGTPDEGGVNLLEVEPDGLSVSCADVRTCFSGGPGINYNPATGVTEADLSEQAGNNLTILPDGLFVPPGGTPEFGCGLEIGPEGLQAGVVPWPHACPQDTNATGIYCSPTTGKLQGPPVHRAFPREINANDFDPHGLVAGAQFCITTELETDTTLWCTGGFTSFVNTALFQVDSVAGGSFEVNTRVSVDGAPFAPQFTPTYIKSDTDGGVYGGVLSWPDTNILNPGTIHTYELEVCVLNTGPGSIFVQRIGAAIRGFQSTRQF